MPATSRRASSISSPRPDGLLPPRVHGPAAGGIEPRREQVEETLRDAGIGGQRRLLEGGRGVQSRLHPIAAQGADQRRLPPVNAELEHQTIEAVALRAAFPNGGERFLERLLDAAKLDVAAVLVLDQKFVDPDRTGIAGRRCGADRIPLFHQGAQAHVLQDRCHPRQPRRALAEAVELEAELEDRVLGPPERPDADLVVAAESFDDLDVGQRLGGVVAVPVTGGEGRGVGRQNGAGPSRVGDPGANLRVEIVGPRASGSGDLLLYRRDVGGRVVAGGQADDELHPGQGRVREAGIVGGDTSAIGPGEHLAGPDP